MLTNKQKREIAVDLLGSCMLPMDLSDHYNCSNEDIEMAACVHGVEMCAVCGWWHDNWDDSTGEIVCADCQVDHPEYEEI